MALPLADPLPGSTDLLKVRGSKLVAWPMAYYYKRCTIYYNHCNYCLKYTVPSYYNYSIATVIAS
jgi:hypothetical protein